MVYRAIEPDEIDPLTGNIQPKAFFLRREKNEKSLSVFSTDILTPRDVIQRIIEEANQGLASRMGKARQDFERWLDRKGNTVERRVELGWRVAKMPLSEFDQDVFEIGDIESDGHISIAGDADSFESYALDWIQRGVAKLVSVEQTLDG